MSEAKKEERKKNKTNPLYVVTNNGQDVEQAHGVFDLWAKKLGLDPLLDLLNFILKTLGSLVSNYAMFITVKEIFDGYLEQIQFFLSKLGIGPVAPYPVETVS
jgi:hypothetical protein